MAPTIGPFLGICIVHALLLRLVIFGFSKRLDRDISILGRYGDGISEEFIFFLLIVLTPIVLHYLMSVWGTYQNANKFQKDL